MMQSKIMYAGVIWVVGLLALILTSLPAAAGAKYPGWELKGAYDKHYAVADMEDIKAIFVEEIEVTPMDGMHPGVGIVIYDKYDPDKEQIKVHLGPKGAFKLGKLKLRKGDRLNVRGVFAEIDDEEFFMASKVKKKPLGEVKVRRTSDGKPIWTMSSEELAELAR